MSGNSIRRQGIAGLIIVVTVRTRAGDHRSGLDELEVPALYTRGALCSLVDKQADIRLIALLVTQKWHDFHAANGGLADIAQDGCKIEIVAVYGDRAGGSVQ